MSAKVKVYADGTIVGPANIRPALLPYGKKDVMKGLLMYCEDYYHRWNQISLLYKARDMFGTQFLIDMFVATETYIHKFPKYKFCDARRDINVVLNNNPKHRIMYEEPRKSA